MFISGIIRFQVLGVANTPRSYRSTTFIFILLILVVISYNHKFKKLTTNIYLLIKKKHESKRNETELMPMDEYHYIYNNNKSYERY